MKFLRVLATALILSLSGGAAQASYQAAGYTFTYSHVSFIFTSSVGVFASCNELDVEFTGLFTYPMSIMVYGKVKCPATGSSILAFGSGSVNNGLFSMTFSALGSEFDCMNFPEATLSGVCTVWAADNTYRGTAIVTFR